MHFDTGKMKATCDSVTGSVNCQCINAGLASCFPGDSLVTLRGGATKPLSRLVSPRQREYREEAQLLFESHPEVHSPFVCMGQGTYAAPLRPQRSISSKSRISTLSTRPASFDFPV
jgi:hypothetical protein